MIEPQFAPAISKSDLVMLNGPTKRSIIASVAYCRKKGIDTYENKYWKIEYLGTQQYKVIDKNSSVVYRVDLFHLPGWDYGEFEYSVYKRRQK